ncbi:hypothetical protein [Flavobacterium lindanitolerans]|uniref:Uncharacterized protein n=1 Tax=Flavobacterium lindanitolerans TaxID=428988 RepID=A0A497U0F4_9FLAO|nr:hypothetical protein [Flavobacterium lindanitolerans]PKW20411.1 hypothetical protein B0G92_3123 [Flavobacterium lindanitolerans]RLJ23632.1 hypothetical protein CLV50_2905 [Flavobacterium lindanitolerans]
MKTITNLIIVLVCCCSYAQNKETPEEKAAKKELTALYQDFSYTKGLLELESKKLRDMNSAGKPLADIEVQAKKERGIKKELDGLYKQYETVKAYHLRKVSEKKLNQYFPPPANYKPLDGEQVDESKSAEENETSSKDTVETEKAVYIMYGDKKIADESIFKNREAETVFKEILSVKSETCLGNFEIPGHKQKIQLYDVSYDAVANQFVCFKQVKFSIRDGNIYDIRVTVTNSEQTKEYYFENRVPISMLNYPREAKRNFLSHRSTLLMGDSLNGKDEVKNSYIRISDVLTYLPNPGNNFVPDDVEYTFPTGLEKEVNEEKRRLYLLNQDTNLQNVMELRTYTDFLGLFDDTPNGIMQIEGKADFFVVPFQVGRLHPMNFFKKVSPYVHYTRLDDDHKGLTLIDNPSLPGTQMIGRPLEIIEKSYLDMGAVLDVFSFSFIKESPFNINLYYALRYQIATIDRENEENLNFKTLGHAAGVRFEFKRFNNFGFNFSPEFAYYNHMNKIDFMENPKNIWVFRNEAEIFYYPGESKKQSVFLRLRTFMDVSDSEDSFFQLQFGYRFSIGLGSVKGKGL